MELIESLKKIVNGPRSAKCQAFSFICTSKRWVNKIGIAAQLSGCHYTIVEDPEVDDQYAVYVTGSLAQLRQCVTYLETQRKPG